MGWVEKTEARFETEASMSTGDSSELSEVLSARQAFLAMTDFIWRYAESAGDDLISLLGDTDMESDGQPTDPAAWDDWLLSVRRILAGQPPRTDL
jgi:hypothetical protein